MATSASSTAEESSAGSEESEAASTSSTAAASGDATSDKVWKIGVSTQSWEYEFIKNMVNALKQIDEDMPNVELVLADSKDDITQQLSDVDTFIAEGCDGVLLNCLNAQGDAPAVEACKKAGIPLVEFISYTENDDYATFVGTDVKSSGVMAMNALAKAIGEKGKILHVAGQNGHTATINRGAGIEEALKDYPDIELVDTQSGEFSKDKAMSVVEAWLAQYPEGEIQGIVCDNDQMGLGAMNACQAANRPEIKIVSIDGDLEALQSVKNGKMAATCLDYCEKESKMAVEEMVSILEGNEPKGKILVDYELIDSPERADEFIALRS